MVRIDVDISTVIIECRNDTIEDEFVDTKIVKKWPATKSTYKRDLWLCKLARPLIIYMSNFTTELMFK